MTDGTATAGTAIGTQTTPPPGLYVQIYRDKVPGHSTEARTQWLAARCAWARQRGLPGVVFHGFSRELARNWDRLAKIANDAGILALASWGLDSSRDDNGTRLTAAEKGRAMADVLSRPSCAAGLGDAEGQWDDTKDAADDMNEHGAIVLGHELRAALAGDAASKLFGDQPWFAIDSHGELRRTPRPIDAGGVFAGFPVDEFAVEAVNWIRFPQMYCNDFIRQFGRARYFKVRDWMERDWTRIEPELDRVGLKRPRSVTIQMYAWELHHLVHCMLTYIYTRSQPMIGWSEPWPDAIGLAAIQAVESLARHGFAVAGRDARDIVRAFQHDAHMVDADGWCGPVTCAAMGISV